jgi:hypothetical protein
VAFDEGFGNEHSKSGDFGDSLDDTFNSYHEIAPSLRHIDFYFPERDES